MRPGRVIVADAARGQLQEIYHRSMRTGKEQSPACRTIPLIPLGIARSAAIQPYSRRLPAHHARTGSTEWETFHIIPIESGRGCPYGCEFCTVTGFFGDSIRFRTNQSIVDELLLLKRRARDSSGKIAVFFVDDNFAINVKRHQIPAAGHHCGRRADCLGGANQRQPAQGRGTG